MSDTSWPFDLIVDQRNLCRGSGETSIVGSGRKRLRICPTSYRPELCLEDGFLPQRSERIHILDCPTGPFE